MREFLGDILWALGAGVMFGAAIAGILALLTWIGAGAVKS